MTNAVALEIFGVLMGVWALGYGAGNAVFWVQKIKDVS